MHILDIFCTKNGDNSVQIGEIFCTKCNNKIIMCNGTTGWLLMKVQNYLLISWARKQPES